MNRRIKILGFLTLASAALGCSVWAQSIRWDILNFEIRRKFPDVIQIDPSQLAAWLADAGRKPPLLIDVRTQAEFNVSHLRGARRVEPGSPASALDVPKDAPIVAYCSVGYRSSAFAEALVKAGFQHPFDLKGSIFQWANEGRPVFQQGRPAAKVHPFNSSWGGFLEKKYHADVPPIAQ